MNGRKEKVRLLKYDNPELKSIGKDHATLQVEVMVSAPVLVDLDLSCKETLFENQKEQAAFLEGFIEALQCSPDLLESLESAYRAGLHEWREYERDVRDELVSEARERAWDMHETLHGGIQ